MARSTALKLASLIVSGWLAWASWPKPLDGVFLNVGQGLAVLYQSPSGFTVLYDTGPNRAVATELGAVLPLIQRTIDLVIISHAHADHLDGLRALLESYTIREVWLPALPDNELGQATRQALATHPEINVQYKRAGAWRVLPDGITLTVWHPGDYNLADHAATQVVAIDEPNGQRLLLTGDLDSADETEALGYCQAWLDCTAKFTIQQVSHHGSATSTGEAWLTAIHPDLAVISVGANNYGHPAAATLERLKAQGVPTRRTDLDGRVLTRLTERR